ncbi:MAG TPA: MFS transporter [Chloroflexota bacterium]
MYGLIRLGLAGLPGPPSLKLSARTWPRVGRVVILLGITSLLTDISAEMVAAVLPLYLLYQMQISTVQFGILDGIYQGSAALVRLAAGFAADRWRRQKDVAAAGYALSVLSRVGLLAASGALPGIAASLVADRIGKGIRSAPRDALISLSVPKERLGLAFGVHRTFDTGGAFIGPLAAFGLLALAPFAFDIVFVPSLLIALIGLGVIVFFVHNQDATGGEHSPALTLSDCGKLLRSPRFRGLVIAAAVLTTATVSDAFIYVALQRRGSLALTLFPLLYVGTALCYLILAAPTGWLADRVGRRTIYLTGQGLMVGVYGVVLAADPGWVSVAALPLMGAYYACTDGVLVAAASSELEPRFRTSGLAIVTTVTSLAALASSTLAGVVWSLRGMEATFQFFLIGLLAALALGVWRLPKDG